MLLASGVTDAMIRSRLRAGDLLAVRQGVFLGASFWPDDPAAQHLVRAHAEQVANPDAVLSHQSAAVAWGLPAPGFERWDDLPVAVTFPDRGHGSQRRGSVHHIGPLPTGQVQRDPEGYPVTSPARTAVDLAADLPLPEALVVLDGAARVICASLVPTVRRRDYANPRLVTAATDLLLEAARIVRTARLTSALALVNPSRESAAESLSAGHIELAGVAAAALPGRTTDEPGRVLPRRPLGRARVFPDRGVRRGGEVRECQRLRPGEGARADPA